MTERTRVGQMVTLYARYYKYIKILLHFVLPWQLTAFHKVTKHPLISTSENETLFRYPYSFFSALTIRILNRLRLPWIGASSTPSPKFSTSLQPARFPGPLAVPHLTHKPRRHGMPHSNRNIYFLSPNDSSGSFSSVSFESNPQDSRGSEIREPQKLSFSVSGCGQAEASSFPETRCSERGCVFPAASPHSRKCSYHLHQQEEPILFCSHQPTGLLLDPVRTAPTDQEYDGSRRRDRRRLAAIWEQFQGDGTL